MPMLLSKKSGLAFEYFTDDAGSVCIIGEGLCTKGYPSMILGPEHHCMVLNQWHTGLLVKQLINFTFTGQLLKVLPPEDIKFLNPADEDSSI